MTSVSLIITTYNWPQALNLTLASVARQSRLPDEVVIADDGSGEATAQIVREWRLRLPCPVLHVWQEDRGFRLARSRNRAIVASSGDYIVLVDGDVILHPRFVEDHVQCARPDCFIQAARPQLSAAATAHALSRLQTSVSPLARGLTRRPYALRNPLLSRMTSKVKSSLCGIHGCNQSFWREHAIRVNGYDERFTGWGPEDREFAARLLHIGVARNYVRHRAVVFHLHHKSRAPQRENPLDELMRETLRTGAVRCAHGLDSHTISIPQFVPTAATG